MENEVHSIRLGEEAPLGMNLCTGKKDEHVELLELASSGIHVTTYWTKLLPKKQIERKLHQAVLRARLRLELSDVKAGKKMNSKAQ